MANYCSTEYFFYGEIGDIIRFYDEMKKMTKDGEDGDIWDVMHKIGCRDDEVQGSGYFSCLTLVPRFKDPLHSEIDDSVPVFGMTMYAETKWSPNLDDIGKLINKIVDGRLEFVYVAEEPGCEIYENTDYDGIYFHDRAKIDVYTPECEDSMYYMDADEGGSFKRDTKEFLGAGFTFAEVESMGEDEIQKLFRSTLKKAHPELKDNELEEYYFSVHFYR